MVSLSNNYFTSNSSTSPSSSSSSSSSSTFPVHSFLPRYFPILQHRQPFPPLFLPLQSRLHSPHDVIRPFMTPPIASSTPTNQNNPQSVEGSLGLRHRLNFMISHNRFFGCPQAPQLGRSGYLWKNSSNNNNNNMVDDMTSQQWPHNSSNNNNLIRTVYSPYYNPQSLSYGVIDVRRKNATRESTSTLKAWLFEHLKNPYPSKGEKIMLAIITKMTLTQVSTWFANARRRLKKENKMVWSPTKRTDLTSHDDDADDEDFEVSDVTLNDVTGSEDDDDDDDDDEQNEQNELKLSGKNAEIVDEDGGGDEDDDGNKKNGSVGKQKLLKQKNSNHTEENHSSVTFPDDSTLPAPSNCNQLLNFFTGRMISTPFFPFYHFHDNLEANNIINNNNISNNNINNTSIYNNINGNSNNNSSADSSDIPSSSLPPSSSSSSSVLISTPIKLECPASSSSSPPLASTSLSSSLPSISNISLSSSATVTNGKVTKRPRIWSIDDVIRDVKPRRLTGTNYD